MFLTHIPSTMEVRKLTSCFLPSLGRVSENRLKALTGRRVEVPKSGNGQAALAKGWAMLYSSSVKGDWSIKIMESVLKLDRREMRSIEEIVISSLFLLMVKLSIVYISGTRMKRTVVPPIMASHTGCWELSDCTNTPETWRSSTLERGTWWLEPLDRIFLDGESKYQSPYGVKERGQHKRRHNARGVCRRQRAGLGGSEDEGRACGRT